MKEYGFTLFKDRFAGLDITKGRIGPWEITTLNREIVLPSDIQKQGLGLVKNWVEVFPKEPTWVQQNVGIPSLIVRIDGIDDSGLRVYEIEDRPAGIGHTVTINRDFSQRLKGVKDTWPKFDVVISPLRNPADDMLWNNTVGFEEADGGLVFVRAEPDELDFRQFQDRSVSTIATEGDKSYGVALGLWTFIDSPEQFPKRQNFVLKPLQSSKGRNMAFYVVRGRYGPGNVRMKNAEKLLMEQVALKGGMYIQELIPPMQSGIPEFPFMIYRFFYAFDLSKREWISLGGTYFCRNNLKIHGASDSISGPLVIR